MNKVSTKYKSLYVYNYKKGCLSLLRNLLNLLCKFYVTVKIIDVSCYKACQEDYEKSIEKTCPCYWNCKAGCFECESYQCMGNLLVYNQLFKISRPRFPVVGTTKKSYFLQNLSKVSDWFLQDMLWNRFWYVQREAQINVIILYITTDQLKVGGHLREIVCKTIRNLVNIVGPVN